MTSLAAGTIVDKRVEIEQLLGQGGMGTVYRARQLGLDREVAIKFLSCAVGSASEWYQRFEREAQLLGQLHHKNIPAFYGYGMFQESPYMIVELVHGEDLESRLARGGKLPEIEEVLSIARQVCEALGYAHARGIIHRDLKLSNILVTEDGSIRLIDFGLAKSIATGPAQALTEVGTAVGTVLYMSPEQCLGKPATVETDIYSLGCVLFHLITGQPPFPGEQPIAVMQRQVAEDVPMISEYRDDLPEIQSLQNIINCCMAKQPHDRYASAQELLNDIKKVQNGCGVSTHASSPRISILPEKAATTRTPEVWVLPAIALSTVAIAVVLLVNFVLNSVNNHLSAKDPRAAHYWYVAAQDAARAKDLNRFLCALKKYSENKVDDDWENESRCYRDLVENLQISNSSEHDIDFAVSSWEQMEAKHRPNSITHAAALIKIAALQGARHQPEDYSVIERAAKIADACPDSDVEWRSSTVAGIGSAEFNTGHNKEAVRHLGEAVNSLRKAHRLDTTIGSVLLFRLGAAQYRLDEREPALKTLNEAFPQLRGRQMWNMAADCMAMVAADDLRTNNYQNALIHASQAEECAQEMPPGIARTHLQATAVSHKASAYLRLHQPDKCLELIMPMIPLLERMAREQGHRQQSDPRNWSELLLYGKANEADAYAAKQDFAKAQAAAQEASDILKEYGFKDPYNFYATRVRNYALHNRQKI